MPSVGQTTAWTAISPCARRVASSIATWMNFQSNCRRRTPSLREGRGCRRRSVRQALSASPWTQSKLLEVDVDQLAWASSLATLRGPETDPAEPAIPTRVRIPEAVDSAMLRNSAVSGPVSPIV